MSGANALWVWLAVIGACVWVYCLYKQNKIPWLRGRGIKMPQWFAPTAETQIGRLQAQTKKEVAKAKELQSVLEAKTELAKARAENTKLLKEIGGVSEKSVEKDRREEKIAQEAQKAKPKRL